MNTKNDARERQWRLLLAEVEMRRGRTLKADEEAKLRALWDQSFTSPEPIS